MNTINAQEVAARLGVKIETVYAYVSRGRLTRLTPRGGERVSRFDTAEVDALAMASQRRRVQAPARSAPVPFDIVTAVSSIEADGVRYRGRPSKDCAATMTFESVAEWLWTGSPVDATVTWASDPQVVALAAKVARMLPRGALLPDTLRAMTAVIATTDPLRFDLRPAVFTGAARGLLSALVDALPVMRSGSVPRLRIGDHLVTSSFAARLWQRLSPLRPDGSSLAALNAALVMLADHELATSTFGARVAASTRADPYACIAAGLGVLAGPLHGSASAAVHALLLEASQPEGPTAAVARVLRRGDRVPGFGHPVYPDGDPRAPVLLDFLRDSEPNGRRMSIIEGLLDAMNRRHPLAPNVDFALGALAFTAMMPSDAGEAIFALARASGWVAHALEELEAPPLRFRLRAAPSPVGAVDAARSKLSRAR